MFKTMIRATLVAAACGISVAAFARAEEPKQVEVPAGDLTAALESLARQSGVELIYQTDKVKGLRTGGVVGEMTTQDAVTKLLQGTSLTLKRDESGAMLIGPSNSAPISPHGNSKTAPSRSKQSADGTLSVSEGQGLVRIAQDQSDPNPGPQSAQVPAADANSTRGDDKSPTRLGDVIVTATKRAERIQDIPLSITALTAEEIDQRGLISADDYLRGIPGVNQVADVQGQTIVIRGIETSPAAQNFASGTTISTYFGETPTTNTAGLGGGSNVDLKLVDIERVEVLRGPQGTAFGSSSLSGAVRTIPVAPRLDRFEGKVGASYSETSRTGGDNYMIQGAANLPLLRDKFAIRGTAYQFDDTGFYRNVAGSDPAFQAFAAAFGAQALANDKDHVGSSESTGGRIAALYQPTDDLKITLTYLTQKTKVDGQPQSNTGIYEQALLQVAPEDIVRGQKLGLFDTDIDLSNATLEYNFSRANLLATFSHVEGGSVFAQPLGGFAWSIHGDSVHRENSGEVRLTTQLEGVWNFLGGLYAEDVKDDYSQEIHWSGSVATIPFFFGTDPLLGLYGEHRELKQKAVFGEASWNVLPAFTLTGGMRAYKYDRAVRFAHLGGTFFPVGTAPSPLEGDDSGTNFRGNLSYKPNDNALIYAGWSQGFRLGKPQAGLTSTSCDVNSDGIVDGTAISVDSTRLVESDKVDNYELGGKFTLLDSRLLIAADVFRIDWTGVPVTSKGPSLACGFTYLTNAGAARSDGVEVQASFNVTGALRIDVGSSWMDATLTRDAPLVTPPGFDGDRLPGSPKVNANFAVQYAFSIGGHEGFVRADSIYVGPFYGNFSQLADTRAGDYVKVDLSARIAVRNLTVGLFVRNLTNVDDFSFRGIFDQGDSFGYRLRPRTVGIQLGYDIG